MYIALFSNFEICCKSLCAYSIRVRLPPLRVQCFLIGNILICNHCQQNIHPLFLCCLPQPSCTYYQTAYCLYILTLLRILRYRCRILLLAFFNCSAFTAAFSISGFALCPASGWAFRALLHLLLCACRRCAFKVCVRFRCTSAWQLPTLVSALLKAFALESAESPAAAGTSQTPLVQASPVAHGRFAEHDCPSVLGEAGVMHLPAEHLFPVSQSLANEHIALHTLLADVVALPQILLVHSEAAVHATFTPFPCVVINVPDGAVFAGILSWRVVLLPFLLTEGEALKIMYLSRLEQLLRTSQFLQNRL